MFCELRSYNQEYATAVLRHHYICLAPAHNQKNKFRCLQYCLGGPAVTQYGCCAQLVWL